MRLFIGLLFVAAVATAGDYVWFAVGARNEATAGSLHGAALLGAVGLVLGWVSGRVLAGLLAGMAAGVGGALAYYAMAAAMDGRGMNLTAMVAAWAAVWVVLALCDGRWLRKPAVRSWSESLTRGVLAAVLGGIAFYLMFDLIWGPGSRNNTLLMQFGAWLVAWAPGLLAIGVSRRE